MIGAAETIARALGLRRSGREFTGRCPSCGYASGFSVTERNRAILLCCHAGGCPQSELWGALEQAGLATRNGRRGTVERAQSAGLWRAPRAEKGSLLGGKAFSASKDEGKNQAAAAAIWRCSRPADGTCVEAYLRKARGYTGPLPRTLRFAWGKHPSDPGRQHPMMVAAVLYGSRIVAVHRTFLRQDGNGKAKLDPDKMTLGPCKGGAVPLAPAGPVLAVAEGIETALSYMAVTGTPTWAALSAGGIRNLILPECVCEVVIAADPDPVGIMAAHAAARRWLREGQRISIARPPLGCDFNDLAGAS
jgi:putative DNA primase/helicase